MGKIYDEITPELAAWIGQQKVFFVATAPISAQGHVNCSPKGLDSLRVLSPREIGYLDITGNGAETLAHLRENGRIVFMFCAFTGPPKIVRLHGMGRVIPPDSPDWPNLRPQFPPYPGDRSIVHARITRISDSCGFGVPLFDYRQDRTSLTQWAESIGAEGVAQYQREKNARSIDGLPALDVE